MTVSSPPPGSKPAAGMQNAGQLESVAVTGRAGEGGVFHAGPQARGGVGGGLD
jgi:hypothetical protein